MVKKYKGNTYFSKQLTTRTSYNFQLITHYSSLTYPNTSKSYKLTAKSYQLYT